jgi:uncharacterized membrane protein YfcA
LSLAQFILIVFAGAVGAGLLGSLTGLGGGIILTPVLVLLLGVDMKLAIGASLIAVIATSCGAAPRALARGIVNIRLAVLLEVATVLGAMLGVVLAARAGSATLQLLFGLVLLWTAISGFRDAIAPRASDSNVAPPAPHDRSLATRLSLHGELPATASSLPRPYRVHNAPAGLAIMFAAGALSALVGIGSGIVKVLAMDRVMRLPFQVSTATSTLMIGVTAAASVGPYLHAGQILPQLALPVTLGALLGAALGSRLLPHIPVKALRIIFCIIVAIASAQMMTRAIRGLRTPVAHASIAPPLVAQASRQCPRADSPPTTPCSATTHHTPLHQ